MKITLKRYLFLILGLILIALSFNLFFKPFNIVYGDITGLSIITNKLFNMDIFMFIFAINIILIVISYILLGEQKTLNATAYTVLLPFFIKALEPINKLLIIQDLDMFIVAIIAGLATGFGLSLIYQQGFQTGGTETIGDLVKKYTKINSAHMTIIINSGIVLISAFVFNLDTAVYGAIALVLIHVTVRKYMFGVNDNKTFYIFSDKIKEIKKYIYEEEKQDVTIFNVITGLKKEKKQMIMCVLKTKDYYKIKTAIELIDPNSFITITESYESINPSLSVQGKKKGVRNEK